MQIENMPYYLELAEINGFNNGDSELFMKAEIMD